jgi:PAS domain S-box-containing protein
MKSVMLDVLTLGNAAGSVMDDDLTYEQAENILRQIASSASPQQLDSLDPLAEVGTCRIEAASDAATTAQNSAAARGPTWCQQTFQSLLEASPDAFVVIDRQGLIVLVNAQTEALFGCGRDDLLGRAATLLVPSAFQRLLAQRLDDCRQPGKTSAGAEFELYGVRKSGREFPIDLTLRALETDDGPLVIGTILDVTHRKRLEERYRTLVEGIPAVTFMAVLDEAINELYVSPQIEQLLGFSQKEWLEDPVLWHTRLHPDDRARWHLEFAQTCATGLPFRSVYRFVARDGRVVWVQGEAKVVRDALGHPLFIQGMAFDITERKEAEEALHRSYGELEQLVDQRTEELAKTNRELHAEMDRRAGIQASLAAALKEKESLLKEIHHRVKNNLQVISSLLKLQSATVDDPDTVHALEDCRHRVRSMALVHEKLYRSTDLARIDFGQYVRELAAYLFRSYGAQQSGVALQIDVDEASLSIDAAIPCGLIITELVSNCLNHGFRGREAGHVMVALRADNRSGWVLTVSDDGVGFPPNLDFRNTNSLGLQLVSTLTQQLAGSVQRRDREGGGTAFEICFLEPHERPQA